jgi:FkbM family methyltransferase
MKKKVIKIANAFVGYLGVQLVKSTYNQFTMEAGLQRIAIHDFDISSVIDIGASDGKWSREAMRFLPNTNFLAVEPLAEREAALKSLKIQENRFDYELCVAGAPNSSTTVLTVAQDLDGSTVGGQNGEQRVVAEKTIDELVVEKNLPGPYLLKFDTHGYEIPILEGARSTLLNTNMIIMEVYNFKLTPASIRFHEMCAYLENLGFRCYDLSSPMLRLHDKAFWQMDLFFYRKSHRIFSHNAYE